MAEDKELEQEINNAIYDALDKLALEGQIKKDLMEKQAKRQLNSYLKKKEQKKALDKALEKLKR
ncbi:hypothetical protein CPIN18021_0345 [Campylobacter pinnipediorum subsp. caledonicus]|uniref:Uncharacterized protein n=1 Tax=Campylobacter pinnipediorum subsp. caledonicus TaxID=1874362 RepID=A0A1S6U624_9BACT|nr:hypothetical protein [Campylobacter pinnipediorum]AQW85585.1 hypothetical protein CPIN18020_0344 [Campylobacter pinnipediorum subsp. caledonicus]AQW87191.1 hypothetical protein CPIN18021_0345 [Campylobacter pinnipediorum subsp. caledonicus]OPA71865.1 hypothetical protein BB381_06940 [Campylobacter pinnipediorum subsp. caledonicus]